jgi:hypothetical protein
MNPISRIAPVTDAEAQAALFARPGGNPVLSATMLRAVLGPVGQASGQAITCPRPVTDRGGLSAH